jgi:hypothetical protein
VIRPAFAFAKKGRSLSKVKITNIKTGAAIQTAPWRKRDLTRRPWESSKGDKGGFSHNRMMFARLMRPN